MIVVIGILGIFMMLHIFVGRLFVVFVPMYWAYNVAKDGDSFLYAVFTYFGNVFLLWLLWGLVYWLLSKSMDLLSSNYEN